MDDARSRGAVAGQSKRLHRGARAGVVGGVGTTARPRSRGHSGDSARVRMARRSGAASAATTPGPRDDSSTNPPRNDPACPDFPTTARVLPNRQRLSEREWRATDSGEKWIPAEATKSWKVASGSGRTRKSHASRAGGAGRAEPAWRGGGFWDSGFSAGLSCMSSMFSVNSENSRRI